MRHREVCAEPERGKQDEDGKRSQYPRRGDACPRPAGLTTRGGVLTHPAGEPEARKPRVAGEPPEVEHNRGSRDTRDGDDDQPGADPPADVRHARSDRGKRSESDRIEQPEQEDRESDSAEARTRAPATAHDGEANHLVAATRQRDPGDRSCTARRSEGQRCGPMAVQEEMAPTPCLRRIGEQEQHGREPDEPEVRMVKRPAALDQVEDDEHRHTHGGQDEDDVHDPLARHSAALIGSRPALCIPCSGAGT